MNLASVVRDLFRRQARDAPGLSVVVNFFNNRREARNTLYSLTRGYQLGAQDLPYEVIVLDNGSTQPLSEAEVRAFGPEFRYRFVPTRSVSPVGALNEGCREATGEQLLVMVDGAHILTPGIFQLAREAFRRFRSPFVATLPLHLGPSKQNFSVQAGYNDQIEDQLLQACGWRDDGYKLYSVSASFADDSGGWYGQMFESSCFALRKSDYLALGGFEERFQSPGGGLANLDIFQRALMWRDLEYVVLLGEATFHQVHGGVSTSPSMGEHPWKVFHREYMEIRGRPFFRVPRKPIFLGEVPHEARQAVEFSRKQAEEIWRKNPVVGQ